MKALKKDLEEKETKLSKEILQHYPTFIATHDGISEISQVLKSLQSQLSQYSLSISNLKSKISTLTKSSNTNQWQNFINNSLDENWDYIEDENSNDIGIAESAIPSGIFNQIFMHVIGVHFVKSISRIGQAKTRDISKYVNEKVEMIAL